MTTFLPPGRLTRPTRSTSWVAAARKTFAGFPDGAQSICLAALTVAAEGGKSDVAKPMKGLDCSAMEIALAFRGNAYRVVYTVQLGMDVWVVHAFQKKSTRGIRTPKHEIDLARSRLKRLKELLQ